MCILHIGTWSKAIMLQVCLKEKKIVALFKSKKILFLKPARRREVRRQRPQRHTTAVALSDVRRRTEAAQGGMEAAAAAAAGAGGTSGANALVKGESTGGLNRTLHPHAHSDTNHISRWYSVAKISSPRRGSLKLPLLSPSREASPTTALQSKLLHHLCLSFDFNTQWLR